MNRLLVAALLMFFFSTHVYSDPVVFQFGSGDGGGNVLCGSGNDKSKGAIPPVQCGFENNSNELLISREHWNGDAILTNDITIK